MSDPNIATYHPKLPDTVHNNLIERVYEEPYRSRCDQKLRYESSDLSPNVDSIVEYEDDSYDWVVCQSKKKLMKTVGRENSSNSEPYYEPVKYCSFSPQIEQRFQLGFYGGKDVIKWPGFFPLRPITTIELPMAK